jgi:signal peptidase I
MSAKKILIVLSLLLIVVVLGMVISFFANFRVFSIPTANMANTIVPGEKVLCRMDNSEIKRGDIVVFKSPNDPRYIFLKRVIGLPGETVQHLGRRVLIDGKEHPEMRIFIGFGNSNPNLKKSALQEVRSEGVGAYAAYYDNEDNETARMLGTKFGAVEPFQVPQEQYFLLGDCRDNSFDSRYWGAVPANMILGKAITIISTEDPTRKNKLYQLLK